MKKVVVFLFILVNFFMVLDVDARRGCCSWHGGMSGSCRNGKLVCNDGTLSPSCGCESTYQEPTYIYGCTDINSINYNPNANKDDGSCIKKVYGCMDSDAFNYNPEANVSDNSCIAKVYGCINKGASNYNSDANVADGSCLFDIIKTKYKSILYKTKYKYKLFHKNGYVLQKGKKGKRKIVIEITKNEAGEIVSSKVVSNKVVKKPVNKIIVRKKKQ